MIPAFALRYLPHALGTIAVLGAIWWVHDSVWDKGYARCEADYAAQSAAAAAHARQDYLDAIAKGDALSARLAASQAENQKLRSRHADSARSILGVCPDSLRVLHDAAAAGTELPPASSTLAGQTGLVAASAVAVAVGENYADCREYAERLNALIDWHTRGQQ
jgi:hypothetical protein